MNTTVCRMMGARVALLLALFAPLSQAHAKNCGNTAVRNFRQAKALLTVLYSERPQTLYSACSYDFAGRVDSSSCGYTAAPNRQSPLMIQWEHVVPAEAFGHAFVAWREGHPSCVKSTGRRFRGRRCAAKAEPEFRRMEADMYNLVPEIDEINRRRANFPMGQITAGGKVLSSSGSAVGERVFEPGDPVKGDVARTYIYMDSTYPGRGIIADKRAALFAAWSASDPVDAWECRRAWRIEAVQKNENEVVKIPCQAAGLWPVTG